MYSNNFYSVNSLVVSYNSLVCPKGEPLSVNEDESPLWHMKRGSRHVLFIFIWTFMMDMECGEEKYGKCIVF